MQSLYKHCLKWMTTRMDTNKVWVVVSFIILINIGSFFFFYQQSERRYKAYMDADAATSRDLARQHEYYMKRLTDQEENSATFAAKYLEELEDKMRLEYMVNVLKDELNMTSSGDQAKLTELSTERDRLVEEREEYQLHVEKWKSAIQQFKDVQEKQGRSNNITRPRMCTQMEEKCKVTDMKVCEYSKLQVLHKPPTETGPVQEADISCFDPYNNDRFCKYTNICVLNGVDGANHFQILSSKPKHEFLNWDAKKKRGDSASHNWWLRHHPIDEFKDTQVEWVKGTYIWVDPRYTSFQRQPGHFFETGFKITELRKRFPGQINGLMLARKKVDQIADYVCQTFRLAFEEENFDLPPLYFFDSFYPNSISNGNVCFESLLVPQVTNLYFSTHTEVDDLRSKALHMCDITERSPTSPENVLMLARDGRKLLNWNELCHHEVLNKYEVDTQCLEGVSFCSGIQMMYWADFIVASHGSGLAMAAFARKGSVIIDILPAKFRNPDLKSIAFHAGLRYLEFVNMNDTNTGQLVKPPELWAQDEICIRYTIWEVKNHPIWTCFAWSQELYHIWNPDNFAKYIHEAEHRWGRHFEWDICELPGPIWDKPFWGSLSEGNWRVCEPRDAQYCNKDPNCALHPDGSESVAMEKLPFEPYVVLQDYNKL